MTDNWRCGLCDQIAANMPESVRLPKHSPRCEARRADITAEQAREALKELSATTPTGQWLTLLNYVSQSAADIAALQARVRELEGRAERECCHCGDVLAEMLTKPHCQECWIDCGAAGACGGEPWCGGCGNELEDGHCDNCADAAPDGTP